MANLRTNISSGGVNKTLPPQIKNLKILTTTFQGGQVTLSGIYSSVTSLSGTLIVYKQGATPPSEVSDGTQVSFFGTISSFTITGLTNGTQYSFRVFPYNDNLQYQMDIVGATIQGTPQIAVPIGYQFNVSQSNPAVTRLGGAVGKVFAVANSKAQVVQNDFDNLFPFNKMERVSLNGRTMVKIPKTYVKYLYDGTIDGRMMSEVPADSTYKPHPLFLKGNIQYSNALDDTSDNYNDFAYVGAYFTSNNNACTTCSTPQVNKRRAIFRTNARAIGSGWTQLDWTYYDFLTMLWFCASGTRDSQTLMKCNQSGAIKNNGLADGSVSTCVQISNTVGLFYGIENPFSGMFQWIDGINIYSGQSYISTQIGNYADNTSDNYLQLGYVNRTTGGYIITKGYDSNLPFVQTPISVGGSETTYYCDYYYYSSTWRVAAFGGYWDAYPDFGVSYLRCNYDLSASTSNIGSRLLYRAF